MLAPLYCRRKRRRDDRCWTISLFALACLSVIYLYSWLQESAVYRWKQVGWLTNDTMFWEKTTKSSGLLVDFQLTNETLDRWAAMFMLYDDLPCHYPDEVDLRIIVLAYQRPNALDMLLRSLDWLKLDGAVAAVDIWIDRDKADKVNEHTLEVANSFNWSFGIARVHIWPRHVGIYGQWINTWCPTPNSREMALILEEDIVISPYSWLWLRAARDAFGKRLNIAGFTLQSESVFTSVAPRKPLKTNRKHTAFAYRRFGTWGFAPHPRRWMEFVSWYKETVNNASKTNTTFKPYVDKLMMTVWYQKYEKTNKQDSMWSMWFIYFTNQRVLYTIYNNLNSFIGKGTHYLSVHNSAYGGLHFKQIKSPNATKIQAQINAKLLQKWDKSYVKFPSDMLSFDYYGKSSKFK